MKHPSETDLLDDSLTVCWVSIFLSLALPGAQVEHECTDGVHRFVVLRDGVVYELSIAHDALSATMRRITAGVICTLKVRG